MSGDTDSWELAVKRSDGAHKSLLKMIDFFRALARNENEYGRKMTQLSCMAVARDGSLVLDDRGAVSQNDIAPVVSVWESFNRHAHERAQRASKSATEIDAVMDELELWVKDHVVAKKKVVDDVYKYKKDLAEGSTLVSRAQSVYSTVCTECDRAIEAFRKAKRAEGAGSNQLERTEIKKLKEKAKSAIEKAGKSAREYAKEVAEANKFRAVCSQKLLPELLNAFRHLEETRLNVVRSALIRLCLSCSMSAKMVESLDPAVQSSASIAGTSGGIKLFEVVPFDASHVDFVKSRQARLAGTEESAPPTSAATMGSTSASSASSAAAVAAAIPTPMSARAEPGDRGPLASSVDHNLTTSGSVMSTSTAGGDVKIATLEREESTPHFAQVMPNTVVALGVESKREILRVQLEQLEGTIGAESRRLQELQSLVRFYGSGTNAAKAAKEQFDAQQKKFSGLLGARKQIRAASARIGTTPSVFSTLPLGSRYAHLGNTHAPQQTRSDAVIDFKGAAETLRPLDSGLTSHSAPAVTSQLLVHAQCQFNYKAASEKELSFKKGELLIIRDEDDSGWWYAENANNQLGFVPANRLKKVVN